MKEVYAPVSMRHSITSEFNSMLEDVAHLLLVLLIISVFNFVFFVFGILTSALLIFFFLVCLYFVEGILFTLTEPSPSLWPVTSCLTDLE